ncbi:MAG: hypothetical protein ACFUZC_04540 [Chthoniobacteraceae bacterium]
MKFLFPWLSALFMFEVTVFGAEPWTEDDFTEVSGPASPHVAYALRQDGKNLTVVIEVTPLDNEGDPRVKVGLNAAKTFILDQSYATFSKQGLMDRYTFVIPCKQFAWKPAHWEKLRMGLTVVWPGGPWGQDLLRERFLHEDGAATFAPLSVNPQHWSPIPLTEYTSRVEARKKRIFVDLEQPMDGKASVILEDATGKRVRNLLSGQPLTKGPHRIPWDGLDETGNIVAPGLYRWRAISHPGIVPEYLFSFYNHGTPTWNGSPASNWLADHSDAVAATAFGDRVYLGAPVAESGHNIIQLTPRGEKTGHINFPPLVGKGKLFLAADATSFYAIMEGTPDYEPFRDLPGGEWQFRRPLNVMRWTVDGNPIPYDGVRGEKVIALNLLTGAGPHPKGKLPQPNNLAGAALLDGKLYISLKQENRIIIMNVANGQIAGEIKVDAPGLIATDGSGFLAAFSGEKLVRIDPESAKITPLFTPKLSPLTMPSEYGNPAGMAISAEGEIYLSDVGTDQNVKVFKSEGKLQREIGKKGGRALNGPWQPEGMFEPHGLALDRDNQLWVTETDTFPRRNSVWNPQSGTLIREFMGPTSYGADTGAFDTQDHTKWIGGGALWKLDFDSHTAAPMATLYHQTQPGELQNQLMGRYWNFYHQGGRTFLIGYGQGQSVYELRPDGSAKLWAFCGNLQSIAQVPRWSLPKAIVDLPEVQHRMAEAAAKNRIQNPETPLFGPYGDKVEVPEPMLRDLSLLWVDRNGDGFGQPEEFELLSEGDSMKTGYWGTGSPTLDLKIPALVGGKPVLLPLRPDGFLPSGAPNYSLANALQNVIPVESGLVGSESIQDRFGRMIFNSSPLKAVAPDGKLLWSFPNQWVGVHGSHDAPLPKTGVMQGALYFLGTAPLDDQGEAFVMNGNHGRFFVLTTDGIYLDEMFKDVRITQNPNAYLIGGECFGGYFGRAENGAYYLQSGHTDYRIFKINGLDQVQRSHGTLEVSAPQIFAAQAACEAKTVQNSQPKQYTFPEVPAEKTLAKDPNQWPGTWELRWGNPAQPFPFAEVKALRSGDRLYLAYRVKDPSPWVNGGNDWTLLFKTGDSVDFQFSTDPEAARSRNGAAPGDCRLLIAPYKGSSIAVLYAFREPGAQSPMSFRSPWRTEQVDRVCQLTAAQISVQSGNDQYVLTVSVPLADLGLPPAGKEAELTGDFGVIYGDNAGSMNVLRSYWANQATGLVNDVPGEIMLTPRFWGTLKFNVQ